MSSDVNDPGARLVDFDEVYHAYRDQVKALNEGGVAGFAIQLAGPEDGAERERVPRQRQQHCRLGEFDEIDRAILGTLACGFVLVGRLGLDRTILAAAKGAKAEA